MRNLLLLAVWAFCLHGVRAPAAEVSTVRGHVTLEDDRPVAGAKVLLLKNEEGAPEPVLTDTTTSDAGGEFRFPATTQKVNGSVVVDAPPHALGGTYVNPEFDIPVQLSAPAELELTLLSPDGTPAAGVEVAPMMCSGGGDFGEWWSFTVPPELRKTLAVRTDANGRCVLTRLPQQCHVTVDIRDERYAKASYESQVLLTNVVRTRETVQLKAAAAISGRVIYPDGKPAVNVQVVANGIDEGNRGLTSYATSDESGAYRCGRLLPGRYNVMVSDPQKLTKEWTAAAREGERVAEGQTQPAIDLQLTRGFVISGKVTARNGGAPIADAWIRVNGPSLLGEASKADGTYAVRVPPGKYTLWIGAPQGYAAPAQNSRSFDVQKDTTLNFELSTSTAKPLIGRVVGPDGSAVGGAWIRTESEQGSSYNPRAAQSDESGRFTIKSLYASALLHARRGTLATTQPVRVRGLPSG